MTKNPAFLVMLVLSGCGLFPRDGGTSAPEPTVAAAGTEAAPAPATVALGSQAMSAAALDQTTAAEKAAALAAPAAGDERELGRLVVALGPPAEQGIWLMTALVAAPAMGRVEAAGGQSLALELRPGTGGALLSLAAFQALGLKLTDLPELTVFGP